MNHILIFGCGGHGRSVADIMLLNDPLAQLIFVDENAGDGELVMGFKTMRTAPPDMGYGCIIGIGDNHKRKEVFEKIRGTGGLKLLSVIAKTAHIGHKAEVGEGCFVGNFCHIGPEAAIGDNSILNNGCVVDHEVRIGRHCHIGPNATISGRTKIGDLVFIGVGATVIDKVTICADTIIGAGATVVSDITEPGTYAGTPARRVR